MGNPLDDTTEKQKKALFIWMAKKYRKRETDTKSVLHSTYTIK